MFDNLVALYCITDDLLKAIGPLEHVFVQSEISDQSFQPSVLIIELTKAADLGDAPAGILLPAVEGLHCDTELAADLKDRCAAFDLPQSLYDLLIGELRFFHCSS